MNYIFLVVILFFSFFSGLSQTININYDTVCIGDTSRINVTTSLSIDDTAFLWDFNNDNVYNDAIGKVVKYKTSGSGNYIGLKIIDGTKEYNSFKVLAVNFTPSAEFELLSLPCQGAMLEFENQSTVFKSTVKKLYWDFNNDGSVEDSASTLSLQYTFPNPGIFPVRLKVVSEKGCVAETIKDINVLKGPDVNFSYIGHCLNDTLNFINQSIYEIDSILNFNWELGDKLIYNTATETISHIYDNPGTYPVRLTVGYLNGCTDSIERLVTIDPLPEMNIEANPDTLLYKGKEGVLSVSEEFDEILWSTGILVNHINVSQSGAYWCKVTKNGCSCFDTVNITVYDIQEILIESNILTPNGDDINDYFKIKNLESYDKCSLTIYNRYGKKVYSSSSYQNDWKGEWSGETLPAGAYYYSLSVGEHTTTGHINILR